MGTANVLVPETQPVSPDDIVEKLRYAWQQTEVVRVRFVEGAHPEKQMTAPWDK